jgi:hypothetical protein
MITAVVIAVVAAFALGSLMVASLGRAARDMDDLLKIPSDSHRERRMMHAATGRRHHFGTFDSLAEADAAARAKRNALFITANYADRAVST